MSADGGNKPSKRKATRITVTNYDASDEAAYDLLIIGGTLYDGSGSEAIRANVGIRDDRIDAVEILTGAQPKAC